MASAVNTKSAPSGELSALADPCPSGAGAGARMRGLAMGADCARIPPAEVEKGRASTEDCGRLKAVGML